MCICSREEPQAGLVDPSADRKATDIWAKEACAWIRAEAAEYFQAAEGLLAAERAGATTGDCEVAKKGCKARE